MSSERQQLCRVVAGVVEETWPRADLSANVVSATDVAARQWSHLTRDLGIVSLHAPHEHGGAGMLLADTAALIDEAARRVAPAPVLTSLGIASSILVAGAPRSPDDVTATVSGQVRTAVVLDPPEDLHVDDDRVTGTLPPVADGPGAQRVLVPQRDGDAVEVGAIDLDGAGVSVHEVDTLDPTRPFATIDLRDAALIPVSRMTSDEWARALAVGALLVGSELVALAAHSLATSLEHARIREQFGRPIGSFQAIKHTLVDMHLAVSRADAAVQAGISIADGADGNLLAAASTAKALANDAATFATSEAIHIHGGIGFTWEHELHWYHRRARSAATLLGTARHHRTQLASVLGF